MTRSLAVTLCLATTLLAFGLFGQGNSALFAAVPDRTVIPATLRTSIDAKDGKVGREIQLSVTEDVRDESGRILIPKQAKLTGRVTEAIPWTKSAPESKVSIVVERAEWKGHSVALHSFMAGDLKVYTALARPDPGAGEMVAAIEQVAPGERPSGPLPPNTGLARDKSVNLQMATSKDLVTEVISQAHTVRMEQGSTFSLRQLAP